MYRVDLVISNDRHHCEMARALLERMNVQRSYRLRVLSLCELRGIETPERAFETIGAEVVKLSKALRPPVVKKSIRAAKPDGLLARAARACVWRVLVQENLNLVLEDAPDLVIVFNDAAYPYDRIVARLRRDGIPFLLIQEGIRFDATKGAVDGAINQGKGGATAIAVFGESSAVFFRKQGVSTSRIHLTGNPRFDAIAASDYSLEVARAREVLSLGKRNVLFLSNPIEFHGYCTTAEKLSLVRDFILGIDPLFEDESFRLIFKLHGNESPEDFLSAAQSSPHSSQVVVAHEVGLYPLLALVDAAVIFGTTAGLEALLFGVPLGVIEVPGVGFLHDYVREGAGAPLQWGKSMAEQVAELMAAKGHPSPAVERYLDRTLSSRNDAATRVLEVVNHLLEGRNEKVQPQASSVES